MSRDQLVAAGAFALYRAEHSHRIAEFGGPDADDRIQVDFEIGHGQIDEPATGL